VFRVRSNGFRVRRNAFRVRSNAFGVRPNAFGVRSNAFRLHSNGFRAGFNGFRVDSNAFRVRSNRFQASFRAKFKRKLKLNYRVCVAEYIFQLCAKNYEKEFRVQTSVCLSLAKSTMNRGSERAALLHTAIFINFRTKRILITFHKKPRITTDLISILVNSTKNLTANC